MKSHANSRFAIDTAPLPIRSGSPLALADLPKAEVSLSRSEASEIKAMMQLAADKLARHEYRDSVATYSAIIEKYGDRFPQAHFRRLYAAVKGSDFEFAAAHYLHAQGLAQTEDERLYLEHIWLSCLHAAQHLEDALELAENLCRRSKKNRQAVETVAGLILTDMGRLDEGLKRQKAIVGRWPDFAQARWHLALNQLQCGELPEAWENYEARWVVEACLALPYVEELPRWKGESLEGKRLLVWREQGVGDEIRFARLLRDIPTNNAGVTYVATPKLAPLFARSLTDVRIGDDEDIIQCAERFDYQIPIGSLAAILRPSVADMLEVRQPWIARDPHGEAAMRERIGGLPQNPVIGLCWRSGWQNMLRSQHYLNARLLSPLGVVRNVTFVNLQYDECASEIAEMESLGLKVLNFEDIDQKNDLLAAARLIGACDIVVSAGTAVAELSAALGKPTLLFGKKASQLKLGTEGVPWHPNTIYLDFDLHDPMRITRDILTNWPAIANWASQSEERRPGVEWSRTLPEN